MASSKFSMKALLDFGRGDMSGPRQIARHTKRGSGRLTNQITGHPSEEDLQTVVRHRRRRNEPVASRHVSLQSPSRIANFRIRQFPGDIRLPVRGGSVFRYSTDWF